MDFLTKTMKVNEGEVPQYYVECSHPAIIEPSAWEAVQVEVDRRKKLGRRHDCFTPFSDKVICGGCGSVYGSKIWHSNSKYHRVIWQCNRKFKNETKCTTPHVDEEILKAQFLQAVSEYMADPEERIEGLRAVHRTMSCTDFIDADIEEKEAELELLSGMIRNCVMMNASASLTEQEYQAQYAGGMNPPRPDTRRCWISASRWRPPPLSSAESSSAWPNYPRSRWRSTRPSGTP